MPAYTGGSYKGERIKAMQLVRFLFKENLSLTPS